MEPSLKAAQSLFGQRPRSFQLLGKKLMVEGVPWWPLTPQSQKPNLLSGKHTQVRYFPSGGILLQINLEPQNCSFERNLLFGTSFSGSMLICRGRFWLPVDQAFHGPGDTPQAHSFGAEDVSGRSSLSCNHNNLSKGPSTQKVTLLNPYKKRTTFSLGVQVSLPVLFESAPTKISHIVYVKLGKGWMSALLILWGRCWTRMCLEFTTRA